MVYCLRRGRCFADGRAAEADPRHTPRWRRVVGGAASHAQQAAQEPPYAR